MENMKENQRQSEIIIEAQTNKPVPEILKIDVSHHLMRERHILHSVSEGRINEKAPVAAAF